MNKIVYVLPLLALMACEEKKHVSYAPTFKGFRIVSVNADQQELRTLTHGDSIIITAVQATKGDLIYKAQYNWNITFTSDDGTIHETKPQAYSVVYDNDKSDPRVRLRLWDKPGSLSVRFSAHYDFSSANVDSDLPATTGPITTSTVALYAAASGTMTYTVN